MYWWNVLQNIQLLNLTTLYSLHVMNSVILNSSLSVPNWSFSFTLSPKLIIFLWHVFAVSHFSPFPFRVLEEDSGFQLQKILILIPILTLTLILIIIIIWYQTYYRGTGLVDLTSPSGLAQEFCKLKWTSARLTNQLYESHLSLQGQLPFHTQTLT